MINLVEDSKQNIASLVQLRSSPFHESQERDDQGGELSSIEALVQLFLIREEAARNTDEMTSGLSTEGNKGDSVICGTGNFESFFFFCSAIIGMGRGSNRFINPRIDYTSSVLYKVNSEKD